MTMMMMAVVEADCVVDASSELESAAFSREPSPPDRRWRAAKTPT